MPAASPSSDTTLSVQNLGVASRITQFPAVASSQGLFICTFGHPKSRSTRVSLFSSCLLRQSRDGAKMSC